MYQKSITLQLPDDLYERIQEAAEASERPVEKVLMESIDALFRHPLASEDLDGLLADLQAYSAAQLWAVVYRRLRWAQSLRLRELSAKGKQGQLSDTEHTELEQLVNLVDRDMLLRSEALLLLKQRGENVESYLKLAI